MDGVLYNYSIYSIYVLFVLSSQVHARPGVTIKQALKKAMQTRNVTTSSCVVYVAQKDRKMFLEWNTDTMLLGGEEVRDY